MTQCVIQNNARFVLSLLYHMFLDWSHHFHPYSSWLLRYHDCPGAFRTCVYRMVQTNNNEIQEMKTMRIFLGCVVNKIWWHPEYGWYYACHICLYFVPRWLSVWQWSVLYVLMSLRPWTHLWWNDGGVSWRLWWWKQEWYLVEWCMEWPWMSVWWVKRQTRNLRDDNMDLNVYFLNNSFSEETACQNPCYSTLWAVEKWPTFYLRHFHFHLAYIKILHIDDEPAYVCVKTSQKSGSTVVYNYSIFAFEITEKWYSQTLKKRKYLWNGSQALAPLTDCQPNVQYSNSIKTRWNLDPILYIGCHYFSMPGGSRCQLCSNFQI